MILKGAIEGQSWTTFPASISVANPATCVSEESMIRSRLSIATGLLVLSVRQTAWAQTIPVTNVEELYSAVNNSANAGAILLLSPGTYSLSPTDPNGVPRPR